MALSKVLFTSFSVALILCAANPGSAVAQLPEIKLPFKPIEIPASDGDYAKLIKARFNNRLAVVAAILSDDQATLADALDPLQKLMHAGLEAYSSQEEKKVFLDQTLRVALEFEQFFVKAEGFRPKHKLLAHALVLDVRIEILKFKKAGTK
jgi:hypothetical protein